jgi:DNA-binding NarL/FixJ family response regulator
VRGKTTSVIKVLLVDDDALCREGLAQLLGLADDIQLVGVASSGEEAFAIGRKTRPDVVLIDADLPGEQCLEAMRRLAGLDGKPHQRPSFVCLAVYPDQHDAAIQAGAARFLRKDGTRKELVAAIRAAVAAAESTRQTLSIHPNEPCELQGL